MCIRVEKSNKLTWDESLSTCKGFNNGSLITINSTNVTDFVLLLIFYQLRKLIFLNLTDKYKYITILVFPMKMSSDCQSVRALMHIFKSYFHLGMRVSQLIIEKLYDL